MVKNLPAMQETQVQSLGWEDPLEKGMTTHSNVLAWRIPWTQEPGRLWSMGSQRVSDMTEATEHACSVFPAGSQPPPSFLASPKKPEPPTN